MDQLTLWDTSTPGQASSLPDSQVPLSQEATRSATRCRSAAEKLQKLIDAKHASATNMLSQRPTRKRIQDADSIRREAVRLERIQTTLHRLAAMHDNGSITAELIGLTSRAAIESALFTSASNSAIRTLYESIKRDETREEQVLRLTREASLQQIPGFFPTPDEVAERVIAMARIVSGNTILEPSAGTGSLIDAAHKQTKGDVNICYCEVNLLLLDILRAKYEGVPGVRFIGRDFLDLDPCHVKPHFDRVIMNPPFERGQDADHVRHAYSFLERRGILVAIVSAGLFSRGDAKARQFREFLESRNAVVHDLPAGSFRTSGTEAASKLLCIQRSD